MRWPLNRPSWEVRIRTIESYLDAYGQEIYAAALREAPTSNEAERWMEQVFVLACRRFGSRSWKRMDAREWLLSLTVDVVKAAKHGETLDGLPDIPVESKAQKGTEETSSSRQLGGPVSRQYDTNGAIEPALHQDEPALHGNEPAQPLALSGESRVRIVKLLHATQAQMSAEQRHRGPAWTSYAVVMTFIIALLAIFFGLYRPDESHDQRPAVSSSITNKLPDPLQDLPVNVVAQYRLKGPLTVGDLNHTWATATHVYRANVGYMDGKILQAKIWGYSYSESGRDISPRDTPEVAFPLGPPGQGTTIESARAPQIWELKHWSFEGTGNWGFLFAYWGGVNGNASSAVQIYAVNLGTRKSALAKTLTGPTQFLDTVSVSVGNQKLVTQSGIPNVIRQGDASLFGLPVVVNLLSGKNPETVLNQSIDIAAPFGIMENPTITEEGIAFQGIQGVAETPNSINDTWYLLTMDGKLSKMTGAPLDGQPHWIVEGASGTMYWAETTHDDTAPAVALGTGGNGPTQQFRVLMGLVNSEGQNAQPASTLSGPVTWFQATGGYILWTQNEEGVTELVVARPE